jgi:hypothetical protein
MRDFLDRVAYWWKVRRGNVRMRYDYSTGYGYFPLRFDIRQDLLRVRTSQFGYVVGQRWMVREDFEAITELRS